VSVVVVATITPKPDQVVAVRDALLAAVPKVHAEPGCELYAVHEGDGQFVMVERWETPEALKVHSRAEALTTLGGAARRQAGRSARRAPAGTCAGRRGGQGRAVVPRPGVSRRTCCGPIRRARID
jgi:quinol monooxygenase YgiN